MNLAQVNDILKLTLDELEEKIPVLEKLEAEWYGKYHRWVVTSMLGTQADRESETRTRLADEGLTEKRDLLKSDVRVLLTRKEVMMELGRNLRALSYAGAGNVPETETPADTSDPIETEDIPF